MDKKMTIFYKKRGWNTGIVEIDSVFQGIQDLRVYIGDLDIEDIELLYDFIVVDYNEYLLRHIKEFQLVKDVTGNLNPQMKEEYKEQAKQFI